MQKSTEQQEWTEKKCKEQENVFWSLGRGNLAIDHDRMNTRGIQNTKITCNRMTNLYNHLPRSYSILLFESAAELTCPEPQFCPVRKGLMLGSAALLISTTSAINLHCPSTPHYGAPLRVIRPNSLQIFYCTVPLVLRSRSDLAGHRVFGLATSFRSLLVSNSPMASTNHSLCSGTWPAIHQAASGSKRTNVRFVLHKCS